MPDFAFHVTEDWRAPVVALSGELDIASAPQLRQCLLARVEQGVTIDFSDLTFMGATGLGVLVAARNRALTHGAEIVLRGVRPPQMKVLQVTGLTDVFAIDEASREGAPGPHEAASTFRRVES